MDFLPKIRQLLWKNSFPKSIKIHLTIDSRSWPFHMPQKSCVFHFCIFCIGNPVLSSKFDEFWCLLIHLVFLQIHRNMNFYNELRDEFFIDFGKRFFKFVVFLVESPFLLSKLFWERSPSRQLKYTFFCYEMFQSSHQLRIRFHVARPPRASLAGVPAPHTLTCVGMEPRRRTTGRNADRRGLLS